MKDNEDRKLEALFRSESTADDGFSDAVVRRIRRRVWIRRWTLPIAMTIGGLFAAKPALELLSLVPLLVSLMPESVKAVPLEWLPQLPMLMTGLAAAAFMAVFVRLIED